MSYKFTKGAQVIGDLKAADDAQRDTKIDFGEDYIGFETSGSVRMVISGSEGGIGIGVASPTEALDVSGSIKATGDVDAKLRFINTAKYTESSAEKRYVRWDAAGSNGSPGVNNKFVAPVDGTLESVIIRATSVANSTDIAFHKSSNGTENLNTTGSETQTVNMSSANTSYTAQFSSSFSAGEILGISLSPASGFGNVNISCVWVFDWNS